ncbi:MAG: PAS domain-containing protein [Deltaproteobacteria bacterium]|nr:PAS domain-containing protein [Deltaproteobacteria bacterium]
MNDSGQRTPQEELLKRLQVLMLLRVLFISFLMGALIFIEVRSSRSFLGNIHTAHYLLLAWVYFISLIYVFLLRGWSNIRLQAYLQLLMDTLIITILIYATGGIESIFSFLYILSIFSGSILLYRRGGMMTASSSSIFYGVMLDVQYYGLVHPLSSRLSYPDQYQSSQLFFTIAANMAAFYLVAYLSSFLSEQARKSRAELQVRESDFTRLEALHERIIRSLTSGLIVLDGQQRIMLFNPAAETMFSLSAGHVCGRPISECLPQVAQHVNSVSAASSGPLGIGTRLTDMVYPGPEGKKRYVQLSISPFQYAASEQKGWILILQDVTRMREIQEEMKSVEGLALVGELAAGMAHEIRNPMASISGSIEMLRDEIQETEVNSRLMDIILRETERLNDLVADFLLFARAQRPRVTRFDLNQLVMESVELFQNSQRSHPDMQIVTDFQGPAVIESDSAQIKQVLWNLFLNASEAMGQGGTLHIATSLEQGPDGSTPTRATVVVRDSGEGFKEEDLSRIFLPFFTTKEKGSGLGLAIVKRIIDRLGGKTSARNQPAGGAEVRIVLPVHPDLKH